MKRIIYTIVAAAAIITGGVAAAAPAMASSGPQQFVTHVANHPDTTSPLPGYPVAGSNACQPGDGGGLVWANDDLSVKLTPVAGTYPNGAGYRVYVDETGSFAGFADPNTCNALVSSGPVKGSIYYDVQSNGAVPSGANLLTQQASTTHLRDMVTQLFGGSPAVIVGGGDVYTSSYQNGAYTQVGAPVPATSGSIRGH